MHRHDARNGRHAVRSIDVTATNHATAHASTDADGTRPARDLAWSDRLRRAATRPVSGTSSAVFRIAFGVLMVVNVALYLPILVHQYYVDTTFNFTYGPFTFVRPLPGPGVHLVYVAMAVQGVLIALGKWYRPAIASFFVLTTYVFLLDSTYYQNHEYLISLLSFAMIFLPLDRTWSLDARRHPDRASATVPAWVVWFLRFQIGIPYFYGGIAKLNGDWLRAEPLRAWLANRTEIEPMATILTTEAVVWFMAYGALVLDLVVVFALLHRRTRLPAFVIVTTFHLMNVWLFGLFVFPWLMIAATTLFFAPDWPERALRRWRDRREPRWRDDTVTRWPNDAPDRASRSWRPVVVVALVVWVALQVLVPLRHYVIPGNPSWNEHAHRFAWHMKLRDKQGSVEFTVSTTEGTVRVDPRDHLNDKQVWRLAGHPERLVLFSRHLSDLHGGAEVRAETMVSLNGRPPQPIVDPEVDLSSVALLRWRPAPWVVPLEMELPG